MSAQALGRAAANAGRATAQKAEAGGLTKGAKRDPELYILMAVTSAAFGLAGYFFGKRPTSSSSESKVNIAGVPWQGQTEGDSAREQYKYQYHPGGNPKNPPKDAPSALNSVILPKVNLPKELHEKYNKWGKD